MAMKQKVESRGAHRRRSGTQSVTEAAALLPAASLFHSFGDPSRLVILQHLQLGEHRVVDLVAHLGLSQSTVSKHLACLKDAGMVEVRAEGRASVYSLAHPEALVELLRVAERVLELTGDAVTLCPTHGIAAITGAADGRGWR